MGLYFYKIKSLDEFKDGVIIVVLNDFLNEVRVLKLLVLKGVIKILDGELVILKDIIENLKNLKFSELEVVVVLRLIDDVDVVVINGNYVIEVKFNLFIDVIIIEDKDLEVVKFYVNIIVVKVGNENE